MNYKTFSFSEKKWILILLSERNMGIDYIYNMVDHENPL